MHYVFQFVYMNHTGCFGPILSGYIVLSNRHERFDHITLRSGTVLTIHEFRELVLTNLSVSVRVGFVDHVTHLCLRSWCTQVFIGLLIT